MIQYIRYHVANINGIMQYIIIHHDHRGISSFWIQEGLLLSKSIGCFINSHLFFRRWYFLKMDAMSSLEGLVLMCMYWRLIHLR